MDARLEPSRASAIPFADAVRVWARIALLSFGGPAGQIALMHRILVDEKRWIGDGRFLHALNFCMLLPGPEAQQLATYLGWLMHRTKGGVVAGSLFVLPGAVAILALSLIYAKFGAVPVVASLFFGLKSAVLAIVLQALVRLGKRALRSRAMQGIAAAAFVGIFLIHVPFPLIVTGAGMIGFLGARIGVSAFRTGGGHRPAGSAVLDDAESALGAETPSHARPSAAWSLRVSAICLVLWLAPVAALVLALGPDDRFSQIALFFTRMAIVTFGGAYAVLAYVAQAAVETYGWLRPGEMLDGLGMAETTPGPLIMVTQFVGFMAGYRAPHGMPALLAGALAGLLTTWVTFVPCFLWIFLGAPFVEKLRENRPLAGALSAITAAVVGVILNLALWFALHAMFTRVETARIGPLRVELPDLGSPNWPAIALTALAIVAIFRFKAGVIPVLMGSAMAGVLFGLAMGKV